MSERDRRRGPPQALTVLAVAAVLGHLYGLYRSTGPPAVPWFPYSDKVEHLVGFAAPLWLVLLARRAATSRSSSTTHTTAPEPTGLSRRFVLAVTGAFVLNAVLSELAQHFFYVHRTGDPLDALADLLGVLLGLGVTRASGGRPRSASSGRTEAPVRP